MPDPAFTAGDAVKTFLADLPPGTGADGLKLAQDFAVALKADAAAAIDADGPHTLIIGGAERGLMKDMFNAVVNNGVAALEAYAASKGA
jgi:hypothetical protein